MASSVRKLGTRAFRACARRYAKSRRAREAHETAVPSDATPERDEVFASDLLLNGRVVWVRDVQFAHVKGAGMERVVTFSTNALDAFRMWYHYMADPHARGVALIDLLRARCPVQPKRGHLFLFDEVVDRQAPDNVILRITYALDECEHTLAYSLHGNQWIQFPLYHSASDVPTYPRVRHVDEHAARFVGPFGNFYAHNHARYHVYVHDVYGPRARELQSVANLTFDEHEEHVRDVSLLLDEPGALSCSLTTLLELRRHPSS